MIEEYALVPDVFDPAAYSNPDRIEMCLPSIKHVLYQEAIIRDLGEGAWSKYCLSNGGQLHRLTKEILKKLNSQGRLHLFPRQLSKELETSDDWCREALKSHELSPLSGIISSHQTKSHFREASVASIEKIGSCSWWTSRSCSLLLDRKTAQYQRALAKILECANSLVFIDPNLDPSAPNYRDFHQLLTPLSGRTPIPVIELHRSFCLGDGKPRKLPAEAEWRNRFYPLSERLKEKNLSASVFFWQDFHPRYLITNLIGIVADAGFDTTVQANDLCTWARLERQNRDEIQRHFDPNVRPKDLKHRFLIGSELL